MSYSPAELDNYIRKYTDPSLGEVRPTQYDDLYQLGSGPESFPDVLIITGPSRSGKDTLIQAMVDAGGYVKLPTATSRDNRPDEDPDSYIWMRKKYKSESNDEYIRNLVREYDLIEYDLHHGDMYGMPRTSFDRDKEGKLPVINTDPSGIVSLKNFFSEELSFLSILVCPDSSSELIRRIYMLGTNPLGRLATAQFYLSKASDCIDYVFHNRLSENPKKASEKAVHNIGLLLDTLKASVK